MKGIVSKALSNCGRVAQPKLHTTTRLSMASQPRVLKSTSAATKPVAVKLASPKVTAAPKFVEYKSNIINAKSLSEVNVESFPQEITWLSGAPGAGKGTNSKFVSEICGYTAPTIVVSSLLEQPEFKRIKDAGGIVDDESVFKVLSKELSKPQYKNGVVVDGFPRTQQQAEWLASLHQRLSANKKSLRFNFVMLHVNEETSIARQLARGAAIRAQNSILRSSGGILLEERATDVCSKAAKVRYTGFIEKHEAISQTLEAHQFPCYVVDASSTVEAVRDNLYSCLNNNNKLNNTLLSNTFLNQTKQQQFVVSSLYPSAMDSHMQASSSSSGPNRLMFA